ncbi:PREDICTED: GPI inositol-deacylase [Nicrophorus vespilloides]|uniref:GPI inositol-deacylase n=1 Tax=Nicrophorus vespilloides TaxID=110193 RepID=A0ABM1MNG4_NICVS|nr:PREDICTED: GPI inositol-deacylase [Nicrophorus vespilloides]XP_017776114.1 PREDICTED: GPI inositol-deacylase [Nicrophorus vespilloides]
MNPFNLIIIISLIITAIYFSSIISFIKDRDESGNCEMTYMFEYPQFVRVSTKFDEKYKKYGLYAYSEGGATEKARNMQFNGIPILFIPGSMGSHKQVRSLGSISLRKAINSRTPQHFDYFTVDLNYELSAFNGALLSEQLDYVNHSIYKVLDLYTRQRNPQKQIILIGHSMGGIIAKAIISLLPEGSNMIPIVLALAAPLKRPALDIDRYTHAFYANVNQNYKPKPETTFISVAGGYNDVLINTHLTEDGHLHTVATGVPRSWVSTDHVQIVWCKQLVMAINRALFESIDAKTKKISRDHDTRLAIFKHHLVKNSGTKVYVENSFELATNLNSHGEWFESIYKQYSVRLPKGTKDPRYYMIPMPAQKQFKDLAIVIMNMESPDWVFACPEVVVDGHKRYCQEGRHLTHLSEISPSLAYKRRTLRVDMKELKENYTAMTHTVVRIMPTDEPVVLHVDVYNPGERNIFLNYAPKWYSNDIVTIVGTTEDKAIHYEILLPYFSHIIHSNILYVDPLECTGQAHHATISLVVPWDNYDWHDFVTQNKRDPIPLRLFNSKPPTIPGNQSASVRLTLDPTCRYKIRIQSGYHFANMVRFYSPHIVANMVAVVLMTLKNQLLNIAMEEKCSIFFSAIKEAAKPYFLVTGLRVLTKLLAPLGHANLIPIPDWQILADEGLDFFILPFFLYTISVGLVWLLAVALSVSLVCYESSIHRGVLKLCGKILSGNSTLHDNLLSVLHKIPGPIAIILIVMSVTTCGGLALVIATVIYFLKLTQMSQDFIEDLVKRFFKKIGGKLTDKLMKKIKKRWGKKTEAPTANEAVEDKNVKTDDVANGEAEKPKSKGESSSSGKNKSGGKKTKGKEKKPVNPPVEEPETPGDDEATAASILKQMDLKILKEIAQNNEIFFHFTIFLLYLFVTILNIPSLLTWAHNFKYSKYLESDPALTPAFVLCTCAFALWQYDFPRVKKQFYNELSVMMIITCVVTMMYGIISIYRLSFIISGVVAVITVHQLYAIDKPETSSGEDDGKDDDDKNTYEKKVKAKWE